MNEGRITTRLQETDCPTCGTELGAATGVKIGTRPDPGDPNICWVCGEILVFDENLCPRLPTVGEAHLLACSSVWPQMRLLQAKIRAKRKREGANCD